MTDLLTALGLAFVIEGAMYALFPEGMKQAILRITALPDRTIRLCGLFSVVAGFLVIALIRNQRFFPH